MFDLLIEGAAIVTMNPERVVISCGYVGVLEGEIVEIGDISSLGNKTARLHIAGKGKVLLPGLIDCHCHAGHSFTRGSGIDRNWITNKSWLEFSEDIYYRCSTPKFWYAEARLAAAEKIRFGTTTSVNILGNTPRISDMEIIDAHFYGAQSMGTRNISGIGSPNPPWPKIARKWQGKTFTERIVVPEDAYEMTKAVVKKWHNTNFGRTYSFVMPSRIGHAESNSAELSIEQMKSMRKIADEYGTLIHGHAYAGDIAFVAEHCPHCLGKDVFIAHCTGISSEETEILARTGTTVVTGPSALSHVLARCPVTELLEGGGRVVIGTDGNAPDRTFDLWKELRIAQLLHRNYYHDASLLPAQKVLEMVTIDAAAALGMDALIGSIEIGKRADLILIDVDQPHLYPFFNPVEQLVNAASGQDVDTVLVDGEIIMQKKQIMKSNLKQILEEAKREFEAALIRGGYAELFNIRLDSI